MKMDRRTLVGLGIVVLLFANASLLWGWLATPPGTRFVGLRTVLPADTPVYYSYIRQVMDGSITLRDLYTAEPQPIGTFNILWFLVGWFGLLFHLTPPAAFHVSRVVLGGVLLWVLWRAARWWLPDFRSRLFGWLLMFSGGLGAWLVPFLPATEYLERGAGYRWPVDLWMPWASPMMSLGQSSHLVASWLLLVGTVLAVAKASETTRWRWGVLAGMLALLLLNFHPYHWPTVLAVPAIWFGLHWLARGRPPWRVLPYWLPLALAVAVSLAYHGWVVAVNPVAAARSLQNVSRLPPWPFVVVGLGVAVPFAVVGLVRLRRYFPSPRGWWLAAWVLASSALMAPPSQFQARYLQGILVPLAIVATPPLMALLSRLTSHFGTVGGLTVGGLLLALALSSPVVVAARDIEYYRLSTAFYFPEEFFAAVSFFRQQVDTNSITLTSHDSGLFLAAYAGRTLYFGHGDETIGSAAKRSLVELFYTTANPDTRRKILERTGVKYVWYGQAERRLGGPPLEDVPGLAVAFGNSHVTIYRFTPQD